MPLRDIQIAADALLAQRPELMEEAAERVAAHPEWLPKRARADMSVTQINQLAHECLLASK